jgi:plasmid stabilization system protein ParE
LKKFPYIGSPVDGRPGVRLLVHTPILIFYQVSEAHGLVEVLHFWHGSRGTRT